MACPALQVQAFEHNNDVIVPAHASVPGGASISVCRLAAFTGTRFLRAAAEPPHSVAPAFDAADQDAAARMFAIMRGHAPEQLSTSELEHVLEMVQFSMAHALLEGFGQYLQPMLGAGTPDVRPRRFVAKPLHSQTICSAVAVASLPPA